MWIPMDGRQYGERAVTDYPIVRRLEEQREILMRAAFDSADAGISANVANDAIDLIDEMAEALEPFNREAERYDRLVFGEDIDDWMVTAPHLTLGDLRRAAAALKKLRGE